ncbi:MAG TPA: hypothetical protein VMJ10_37585, partial [Kofleriaceae bacterium]|nr:hypothetical protein [Kofleriaceae bacterium]
SGLTSWFGGTAPAYKQAAPAATPAATTSPSSATSASSTATPPATEPRVIAIIVPRGYFPAWDCPDPQQ